MARMNPRTGSRFLEPKCLYRLFSSPSAPARQNAPSLQANKFYLEKVVRGVLKEQYKGPTPTQKLAGRRGGINQLEKLNRAAEFEKYQHRNWREGDVYSPHDLSSVEMVKWKLRQKTKMDAFDALGINPLHEYKNPAVIWEFTTQVGRIKHRNETGLRGVNQRRIAKAIRRSVSMGLMPSVHNHPEVLEAEAQKLALRGSS